MVTLINYLLVNRRRLQGGLKLVEDPNFPVIIATLGGSGTRLYPLTLFQSKPLIPIVNYPIFMRMLEVLVRQGAKDIIFSTKGIENTLRIKDVFRYGSDFSARLNVGQKVHFMYQPHYKDMGSADAIKHTMDYYGIKEEVLVVSGDNITAIDLKDLIRFHRSKDALATVLLKEMEPDVDLSGFGVAELGEDGLITGFVEKPRAGETTSRLINTAVYLFSPKILEILKEMGEKARDVGGDLMPYLVREGYPVYGFECPGYWADVGTPDSFLKTSLDIANQKVENIRFRSEHMISDGVWVHPTTSSRFENGPPTIKRNTVIGGDCEIDPTANIENSTIGDNCIIQEGAKILNSVVMDFVNIKKNVVLNSCIIGRYASIGGGTIIDAENIVEVTGKKEKTPVVGDGVHIVENSILGAYKRVAPITYAHTILKTGTFKDLGFDDRNVYFIEK
jgi:NDP-sugar pyrophosphorylase family protein